MTETSAGDPAVRPRGDRPSINHCARPLLDKLVAGAAALRLGISRSSAGALIVDARIVINSGRGT